MRCLKSRLLIALLTFVIGVAAASLWYVDRISPQPKEAEQRPVEPILIKPKTITEGRELSAYDQGGRFGCGGVFPASEDSRCKASIARARAFLWKHWQERRRGYIIVSLGSYDADSDSHIFVEPDESGAWHIVWRIERVKSMEHQGEVDDVPDIRSVERRRAKKSDVEEETGVPILVFKDASGKEIETL
jgi:hypothetical protein